MRTGRNPENIRDGAAGREMQFEAYSTSSPILMYPPSGGPAASDGRQRLVGVLPEPGEQDKPPVAQLRDTSRKNVAAFPPRGGRALADLHQASAARLSAEHLSARTRMVRHRHDVNTTSTVACSSCPPETRHRWQAQGSASCRDIARDHQRRAELAHTPRKASIPGDDAAPRQAATPARPSSGA